MFGSKMRVLAGLSVLQLAAAGTDAFGVSGAEAKGGCGEKCFCCAEGSSEGDVNYAICNMAPFPDCSANGGASAHVPLLALSFIPIGEATLTHTAQQVSKTCCAGEKAETPYAAPSAYSAPASSRKLTDVKCTTATSVEASLHRTITWDTSYGDRIALTTETKIDSPTMSGFQLTAQSHSLMASGKTEIFAVQSPVSHPCEYTVPSGKYGTVESASVLHTYTQRAEMRYQRCAEQNTMTVTLEYANQNTDNTCSYRESDTPCPGIPKLEEDVHWAPVSSTCDISGSRIKRTIASLSDTELGNDNQRKAWNYEWDCKGRSIQQFDRRSKYNGVSFVWEPKVVAARAGRVDNMVFGLGTECPIDVQGSGSFNASDMEWFRFGFDLSPSSFKIVENGKHVCEAHRDGVLVYPNQCNPDYDPNSRFHDGEYDKMGCGYCYGGGRRNVDVCQNRNFGGFVTAKTCEKKCDNWADCQGFAFGCENAGRCDCFLYPKRGVQTCPAEQGEHRMDFVLKKAIHSDDIRTTNFCWMMSEWSTPGFCMRKSKSGSSYPLTYGDRFSVSINDQDHIEYKQNGFLIYKSRYTAAYYLSRGTGDSRRQLNAARIAKAAKAAHKAGKKKAVITESFAESAADLSMCASSGMDPQNPKFFAVFSLLQGNDGMLHGWRVQDAFFTERDALRPIDLHLAAKAEMSAEHRVMGLSTAGALAVAGVVGIAATAMVVLARAHKKKADAGEQPVLVAGLASI